MALGARKSRRQEELLSAFSRCREDSFLKVTSVHISQTQNRTHPVSKDLSLDTGCAGSREEATTSCPPHPCPSFKMTGGATGRKQFSLEVPGRRLAQWGLSGRAERGQCMLRPGGPETGRSFCCLAAPPPASQQPRRGGRTDFRVNGKHRLAGPTFHENFQRKGHAGYFVVNVLHGAL